MSLNLSPTRRLILFLIPLIFLACMLWLKLEWPTQYEDVNYEDHLVQNLQVVLYTLAAILLIVAAIRFTAQPRFMRWVILLAGVVLFFIAGEEISWGQYIFDYNLPQYFAQNNLEGELNIHNLPAEEGLLDAAFMLAGLVGGLAWLVWERVGRVVLAACIGFAASWVLRDRLASLALAGRTFSGRSPIVQVGIVLIGALILGVLAALLFRLIASVRGGLMRKWGVPQWYLTLYFLPVAAFGLLWKVRTNGDLLGGLFGPWRPFLGTFLCYCDQEPAELLFAAACLMVAVGVLRLGTQATGAQGK
jgi:hypothetical protein